MVAKTKLAKAPWPKPEKPKSRLDAAFEEWAKRNNIRIKDIPMMVKK